MQAAAANAAVRKGRVSAILVESSSLRMNEGCRNAGIVTRYLASHPNVAKVYYPALLADLTQALARIG